MKSTTFKGLQYLPEEMKKLFYDENALYNILSNKERLDIIKKSVGDSKATWGSSSIFHVTELIGCTTKAYFMRNPPEGYTVKDVEPSLTTQYYFFRGNIFDMIFSMAMPTSQVDFNIAVENDMGADISIVGRADWLDVNERGQIESVNDLKTVKNLWYIEKTGVKTDHYIQVLAYSWIFGTRKVKVYYLDLGDLIVKEFDVADNIKDQEDVIRQLKERAAKLYKHLKENKPIWPPEIDWHDRDEGWRCRPAFCPFTRTCHPDHPDLPENYKPKAKGKRKYAPRKLVRTS